MAKPNLFVVSQAWYADPYKDIFNIIYNHRLADVALFTGGEDVDPTLYGEMKGKYTGSYLPRDKAEANLFNDCQDYKVKCLGICRGSQFLTVQSGGRLVQHVRNHGTSHEVFTTKGKTVVLSSTHHQMMNPFKLDKKDFELIGWAEGISDTYLNGENTEIPFFHKERIEPEIVYYPRTESLCIQAHPEIMNPNSKGVELCKQLIREYLL